MKTPLTVIATAVFCLTVVSCGGKQQPRTEHDSASETPAAAPPANKPDQLAPKDMRDIQKKPNQQPVADGNGTDGVIPTGKQATPTVTVQNTLPDVPQQKPAVDRQIIRTGNIGMQVESLDTAERALGVIVAAQEGYISNSVREATTKTARSSSTTIRVPVKNFDALVSAVRTLGNVKNEHISATEVTEEFVDLNGRLTAQMDLDAQLSKLLQDRGRDLASIMEIQDRRTAVRSTIEQIQGRLRVLENQTSFSTLTVNFNEPGALIPNQPYTTGGRLSGAVDKGVDSAMSMVQSLLTIVIGLLPLILIGLIVWLILRPFLRRRRMEREAALRAKKDSAKTTAATTTTTT